MWSHRRALRIGVLVAAGLALVFWDTPSGWVVLGTALVVVLALVVLEFLATPPTAPPAASAEQATVKVPRQAEPGEVGRVGVSVPEERETTPQA
jgi:hypothetical protein